MNDMREYITESATTRIVSVDRVDVVFKRQQGGEWEFECIEMIEAELDVEDAKLLVRALQRAIEIAEKGGQ